MKGIVITFCTTQGRTLEDSTVAEWLMASAKRMNLSGATVNGSISSFGHHGEFHATNMYDSYDQPVQITMVVSESERDELMAAIKATGARLFYTQHPVDYGYTDEENQ
ncbi:DUF190 domain-containing protein [Alteromonas confluentis]|uniref:Uncharacterized protein n=1 Tax=Alteromonas confluentis TaxID=1656094 RepID=A0A1E7ZFX0_9ALTE|nr:DUF190 domain-containing protein [Alteromonas confluentis]OFC72418.1 hypothetical protein BFC18_02305 [Alteromonas confluentis]